MIEEYYKKGLFCLSCGIVIEIKCILTFGINLIPKSIYETILNLIACLFAIGAYYYMKKINNFDE